MFRFVCFHALRGSGMTWRAHTVLPGMEAASGKRQGHAHGLAKKQSTKKKT